MRDTIDMAREAEIHVYPEFEKAFERFANLIRADERDRSTRENAYVLAEREACALVCDDFAKYSDWPTADNCAAAIRARGNT
jgi:hypothetical protein